MLHSRIGLIDFINCLPIKYGLQHSTEECRIKYDIPSSLNQLMIREQLDISSVSSIMYGLNQERFLILPNISISAAGALRSILLLSNYPITELNGKNIALTAKSATSQILLKLILTNAYQVEANFTVVPNLVPGKIPENADGMLLIGDDALQSYYQPSMNIYCYDLGNEWRKMTGLSMVYALWVVNRNYAKNNSTILQHAYDITIRALAVGLKDVAKAAEWAQAQTTFTAEEIISYIHVLNYELGQEHIQALQLFYQLAYNAGFIPKMPVLEFAEVKYYV